MTSQPGIYPQVGQLWDGDVSSASTNASASSLRLRYRDAISTLAFNFVFHGTINKMDNDCLPRIPILRDGLPVLGRESSSRRAQPSLDSSVAGLRMKRGNLHDPLAVDHFLDVVGDAVDRAFDELFALRRRGHGRRGGRWVAAFAAS